jgi:transposase
MNNNDILNEILGMPKLRVMRSECVGEDQINLWVESPLPVASCPDCGCLSDQVHDLSEVQMIRDLPIAERRCYLSYRARRFRCEPCQTTFVERVEWKRTGVSYTERYERQECINASVEKPCVRWPKTKASAKRRLRRSLNSGQKND